MYIAKLVMTEKIEDFIPMQACRKRASQFLPDQLTLSEPREVHYPHRVLHAPLDFQTLRRPCFRWIRSYFAY